MNDDIVTLEHATLMVEDIKKASYDDEAAHNWEDQLRLQFLHDLANGSYKMTEAIIIVKKILETEKFEFNRYCA